MEKIQTVCVIGSGIMGSGIAAQIANSKTNVILLDIADKNSGNKNKIVCDAYDKLFTQKPPPLSHPNYAKYIKLGNLDDDIALIKQADLVIEVIVEKLEIKHQLYESISQYLKPTAILASNTSTLPLFALKEKLPLNIKERFLIIHFFNPPRYAQLVELVTDSETKQAIIPKISDFLKITLGKTIVNCNDTPGFIANRVGCFLLELVVRKAIELKLNPQNIDYIFVTYLGFPSTGIFGLYDLIGHDVMDLISKSLLKSLPNDDLYHQIYTKSDILENMRNKNLIGRKAGAGFYKISKDAEQKTIKQVINFNDLSYSNVTSSRTMQWRGDPVDCHVALRTPRNDVGLSNIGEFLAHEDKYSKFITDILKDFFSYVISLIPEVTDEKENIDKAMKLGYSLKYGPFELLSRMPSGGEAWLKSQGLKLAIPADNIKNNTKIDADSKVIFGNDVAELRVVDNHHVFTIKSKMNSLDYNVFNLMIDSIAYCEQENKIMYILPNGSNFSAGANLHYFKNAIENKNFKEIESLIALGQKAMIRLKYAKIPVISCAKGLALGGGCEILLHSKHVIAHQNLNAGLVELGVGLIPAFGGTKEMFVRGRGDKARLLRNLNNILTQNKSSSSDYFNIDYNIECLVNMHKDLILEQAFATKIDMFDIIIRNKEEKIFFPDVDLSNELNIEGFDELQLDILAFFQKIIDKKSVTEDNLLDFELEKFLELASKPLALERINKFI